MIDNPKIFITYVVAIVLVVAALITGVKLLGNGSTEGETTGNATTTEETTGTKPATQTTSKPATSKPVAYDALVSYTSTGFSPNRINIKAGDVIRFVNKTGNTMRVFPVETVQNATYAGLKQENSVGKNGTFDVHFSQKGVFLYENLNDKSKTGIVVVQ